MIHNAHMRYSRIANHTAASVDVCSFANSNRRVFDVTGLMTSSDQSKPALDVILFFKTRAALVVAALAALDAMPVELARLKTCVAESDHESLGRHLDALERLIDTAAVGADNLLVADEASVREPFVMCSVTRQTSGAVDVRTIELDRDALALAGASRGDASRPFNRLMAAIPALLSRTPIAIKTTAAAIDAVSTQVRASVSRLSIVKARLDLQQSFLSSVMEADAGSTLVRLDSHLDQASARDMALEARRLLSNRSLTIASGNRKTLTSLFEAHTAKAD